MTRISAIGIALLCALCVTSCSSKSKQTSTASSSEKSHLPVAADTAAAIVPLYAKGYTVKYLPDRVRLVDIHDPQKENGNTFHYALVPKGIKPAGVPLYGDRNAGGARHVYDISATFQLHPSGCLRLCGGYHQYAPSLQQGDERPFEVRRDCEDWYRREL